MTAKQTIDWSQCPLVEVDPDAQGGVPLVRGTRVPASAIVETFYLGRSVAELSSQLKLPQDRIRAILFYAKSRLLTGQ
jgi:uncharacterized protein (DUF433 family)